MAREVGGKEKGKCMAQMQVGRLRAFDSFLCEIGNKIMN